MTRKEALEYVNNMYMYEDTKNALETLIPEFGKAGSDKVIDHEDKYKEALLEARAVLEPCLKYSKGKVREALDSIDKELKSFESEDEGIRESLVQTLQLAKRNDGKLVISNTLADKYLAYLEKQKEQKPEEKSEKPIIPEWSEEALNVMNLVYRCIRKVLAEFAVYTENEELLESREETVCYYSQRCAEKILKSLRPQPSWKPSEEQMTALEAATVRYQSTGLESLYEDLKKL